MLLLQALLFLVSSEDEIKQTDRQADRQKNRQADGKTEEETERLRKTKRYRG